MKRASKKKLHKHEEITLDDRIANIEYSVGTQYEANGRVFQIDFVGKYYDWDYRKHMTRYNVKEVPDRHGKRWNLTTVKLSELVQSYKVWIMV